jgi:putative sterol carrier protein
MIREGAKSSREEQGDRPATRFAPLTPIVEEGVSELDATIRGLAEAMSGMSVVMSGEEPSPRIQLRLVEGDETVETLATADGEPDVIVVLSRDTWLEIARGRLAPYEALVAGRLRVGGDVGLAKRVTQHLSDPSVPYVEPC